MTPRETASSQLPWFASRPSLPRRRPRRGRGAHDEECADVRFGHRLDGVEGAGLVSTQSHVPLSSSALVRSTSPAVIFSMPRARDSVSRQVCELVAYGFLRAMTAARPSLAEAFEGRTRASRRGAWRRRRDARRWGLARGVREGSESVGGSLVTCNDVSFLSETVPRFRKARDDARRERRIDREVIATMGESRDARGAIAS